MQSRYDKWKNWQEGDAICEAMIRSRPTGETREDRNIVQV